MQLCAKYSQRASRSPDSSPLPRGFCDLEEEEPLAPAGKILSENPEPLLLFLPVPRNRNAVIPSWALLLVEFLGFS